MGLYRTLSILLNKISFKLRVDDDEKLQNQSLRILRLNQFINIYNHIKQQSEVLQNFESKSNIKPSDKKESESIMTESKFYDT